MSAHRGAANHWQLNLLAEIPGFRIEIIEHFHVVGKKTDGSNHDRRGKLLLLGCFQAIENVGPEPGLRRRPAAALVGETIAASSQGWETSRQASSSCCT